VRLPGEAGIRTIPLEQYVSGVVAGEIAVGTLEPRIAPAVLAVQAVLARTYAAANVGRHAREGFDLCSTTHCQVYRPPDRVLPANQPKVDAAATQTAGQVLTYAGRPALALFHAHCGGRTSAAERIWGGPSRPYLTSVRDESCARDPASAWRFSMTMAEARDALNRDPRTAVGSRLDDISVVQQDEAGRVELVALDGERSPMVRGEELRAVLSRQFGDRSIRSPRFEIRRESGSLHFAGRGRGHGAGLCQHGAMDRLRDGATLAEVFRTYYPGTQLTQGGPGVATRRAEWSPRRPGPPRLAQGFSHGPLAEQACSDCRFP
jgi:stage II sporulation protein D